MNRGAYLENIAILLVMALLVIVTGSNWWALLMLWVNYRTNKGPKGE